MSYGTCVSAGEKAIGLDQDKRKKWGGEGGLGQTNKPQIKTDVDQPHPHSRVSTAHESNPPALAAKLSKLGCTCLFIHRKPLPREKRTHTPELRQVLRDRALGIAFSLIYLN